MTFDAKRIVRDDKGRFAGYASAEASIEELDRSDTADLRAQRAEALANDGYVPAIATKTYIPAATTKNIAKWWGQQFANAEYGHREGDHLAMPDDYTPNMTGGRALSGNRRTHRMNYEVAENVSIRMPSKTSVRRFSKEHHDRTFDVPVSATIDGKDVTGFVRVTRGAGNQWEARGIGFPEGHEERIAESVSMTLEGQRRAVNKATIQDVVAHRAARREHAVAVDESNSSWIEKTTFTPDSPGSAMGTFTMQTRDATRKDGTVREGYAYIGRTSSDKYRELVTSKEPGKVWNEKFKSHSRTQRVEECPKCGLAQSKPHAQVGCPKIKDTSRADAGANRDMMREAARRMTAANRKNGGIPGTSMSDFAKSFRSNEEADRRQDGRRA